MNNSTELISKLERWEQLFNKYKNTEQSASLDFVSISDLFQANGKKSKTTPNAVKLDKVPVKDVVIQLVSLKKSSIQEQLDFSIEVTYKSNLKKLFIYQASFLLLEQDQVHRHYSLQCFKEIKRLSQYLPKEKIVEYLTNFMNKYNRQKLYDIFKDISNLPQLFIERNMFRQGDDNYMKKTKEIFEEWDRLRVMYSSELVMFFAHEIVCKITSQS